jgi:uncharacterized protein (DUF4213/DUF364 family)
MRPLEPATGSSLAARIVRRLLDSAMDSRVSDVRIGLGYTAVVLADGRAGVAFTFRDRATGGCSVLDGIRPLSGRIAADLLVLLASEEAIEAGVGLACANALANRGEARHLEGDVLDHVELRPDDHVGMVGHFGPLIGPIQARARSLTVFERVSQPSGLLRPREEAYGALPRCQVALVTATSVINNTVDGLLEAARGCREVALLGASTPLLPEAFGAEELTVLSGVVVMDSDEVLRVVSEGGGMREFGRHVRKVSVRVAGPRAGTERSTR